MLAISLLFWQVIFLQTTQFGNWTFEAILMLHLYSQIFVALFLVFFMGCHVFWRSVQTGRLDVYLTRPLDPRVAFLAEQMRFHGSYRLFINLIVIGAILWILKVEVNLIHFTLTLIVVFTGTLVLTVLAPFNIAPGSLIYPKYVEVCVLICQMVEVPFNGLWGGLINGGTYGVIITAGFTVIRLIRRKKKK